MGPQWHNTYSIYLIPSSHVIIIISHKFHPNYLSVVGSPLVVFFVLISPTRKQIPPGLIWPSSPARLQSWCSAHIPPASGGFCDFNQVYRGVLLDIGHHPNLEICAYIQARAHHVFGWNILEKLNIVYSDARDDYLFEDSPCLCFGVPLGGTSLHGEEKVCMVLKIVFSCIVC